MPRIHVYANQKVIDGINELVDEGHANGATLAEVNKSSVAAELLEIGLRVKRMKNRKEAGEETPEDIYKRALLEECVKARIASQQVLSFMFDMQEIKSESRYDYKVMRDGFRGQTETRLSEVLDGDK